MVILYDLIFLAFALFSLPSFILRLRQASDPRRLFRDRAGILSEEWLAGLDGREIIWVHAVSVGEVLVAEKFLSEAAKRFSTFQFVLSVTTPTGFEMARKLQLQDVPVFYAPFDLSWSVKRVLRLLKPRALLLMETEIWPNLIRLSHLSGVQIGLINGRLSPRSFKRYVWIRQLLRPLLAYFTFMGVQTEKDSERYRALGAPLDRVHVVGNMKFDRSDEEAKIDAGRIRKALHLDAKAPVLLAGSTHPGEEAALLNVFHELRKEFPSLFLILAPRHIERAEQIMALIKQNGFEAARYSEKRAGEPILLLDVMGKLRELYAIADVVFMGGSFIKHGGQNPVEAIRFGRPVLSGPFVFNFQAIYDLLAEERGVSIVHSRDELCRSVRELLRDDTKCREMGARASTLLESLRGAVGRHLDLIETHLMGAGKSSPAHAGHVGAKDLMRSNEITGKNVIVSLKRYYLHLIEGEEQGFFQSCAITILRVLGVIYRCIVAGRGKLFDAGALKVHKLPIPVVSVGNLTWGGTGKTPLVDYIARYYRQKNRNVLILTRGYGQDEWKELKARQGDVHVSVGGDRYRSGMEALSKQKFDVAILDDGFQHRQISRQLNMVTINALNPFGSERLIPAGILREPVCALKRADLVVITHSNLVSEPVLEALRARLGLYGHGKDSIMEAAHEPEYFYRASSGKQFLPDTMFEKKALVFSGIGSPDSFERTLRRTGVQLERVVRFGDHHRFSRADLQSLKSQVFQSGEVITTEKDFLRAPDLIKDIIDPLVLKIGIRMIRGEELLHARLDRILGH